MANSKIGKNLLVALTETELIQLLDSLWAILSPDLQEKTLAQMPTNTADTIRHIVSPQAKVSDTSEPTQEQLASIAKQAETWATAWRQWSSIVNEASEEDGDYIEQEAHWEPPYLDTYAFVEDLEKVAKILYPLIENAFEHRFAPHENFAEAILEAGDMIGGLPEWIYPHEGFVLEPTLTRCVLKWEWLTFKDELEQDAFAFAELVLNLEGEFGHIGMESNTWLEFFTELSEPDQKAIFQGLSQNKASAPWKSRLANVYDHWHSLYLYYVEQFSPEQLMDNLRQTIPGQWKNGLTVLEELLEGDNYQTSLAVVEETLASLLATERIDENWTIGTSLIVTKIGRSYGDKDYLRPYKQLFEYYRQTASKLNQTEVVQILSLQLTAFNHVFNWQRMLAAFAETSMPEAARQNLLQSWYDYNIRIANPYSGYHTGYYSPPEIEQWWLIWLLDSLIDETKGAAWFQKQLADWLAQLSETKHELGQNYGFLRMLTRDLIEAGYGDKGQYPKFYNVVIWPTEFSTPNQAARQHYLGQSIAADFMDKIMAYWKSNLHNFVPRPEHAEKSVYTSHAQWMTALKELVPDHYETLLETWRTEHHRRRNLWKAMDEAGLT